MALGLRQSGYKKSPSLFEMSQHQTVTSHASTRFSSKYPASGQQQQQVNMSSFLGKQRPLNCQQQTWTNLATSAARRFHVPNSVSLHDCKLSSQSQVQEGRQTSETIDDHSHSDNCRTSEYKLAHMLLKYGSNPTAKDEQGFTALMHSIMSENLAAFKCLLEHGVKLNESNNQGLTALDLICSKSAKETQMEMFNLLIDNRVDFDQVRELDGTRLLDRLIGIHDATSSERNKLAYIDCLLHNGAKLGSSTWLAASGKHEIQLRLLRKLCQDGYFLYKKSSIEAAVYRFEYALKRITELEQQLSSGGAGCRSTLNKKLHSDQHRPITSQRDIETVRETQHVKYQTYLGLSRCERKRKFYRRALEFAHMSILVDSASYEGYYSKAHILKDIGELNDSLLAIDQTDRLVNKSVENIKNELMDLQNQEESIVFDGVFQVHDPNRSCWIEAKRAELIDNLEYLEEAKKHISRLRSQILEDKLKSCASTNGQDHNSDSTISICNPRNININV